MDVSASQPLVLILTGVLGYLGGLVSDRIKQKISRRGLTTDATEALYAELAQTYVRIDEAVDLAKRSTHPSLHLNMLSRNLTCPTYERLLSDPLLASSVKNSFILTRCLAYPYTFSKCAPLSDQKEVVDREIATAEEYLSLMRIAILAEAFDVETFLKYCSEPTKSEIQKNLVAKRAQQILLVNQVLRRSLPVSSNEGPTADKSA